jgi:2-polyprenyl-6-methoxyphenol hydroxylase-like FAD-dependent oxidoreductase
VSESSPGRILISGASIAGPALACWLAATGWDVTVIERVDHLREEGQNVDIRGVARHVLRRMGLEGAVRSAGTGESGTEILDERGHVIAFFPAATDDSGGATAELEILRGELSAILHQHSRDQARYVFGDHTSPACTTTAAASTSASPTAATSATTSS